MRRLAHHRHLGLRVGAREARQDLRQVAVGVVVGQAEAHAADELVVVEGGDAFRVEPHDAAGIVEQALALVGELGQAPVALEDRPADPVLQALHLHGHRALRLVDDLRRAGEGPGIRDRHEGPELVDIEQMHGVDLIINEVDDTYLKQSFQVMNKRWYNHQIMEMSRDFNCLALEIHGRSSLNPEIA